MQFALIPIVQMTSIIGRNLVPPIALGITAMVQCHNYEFCLRSLVSVDGSTCDAVLVDGKTCGRNES